MLTAQRGNRSSRLAIRARPPALALIAILPLLLVRVWSIQADRSERIEAASRQALILARQGMAAQNEALVSARRFTAGGRKRPRPHARARRPL